MFWGGRSDLPPFLPASMSGGWVKRKEHGMKNARV